MRPGGGGFNKEKGRKILAWVSFGFALVGGTAAAATFIGDLIDGLFGFFPGWVAGLALAALVVGTALDLFNDGEPNRFAVYAAMALPSLARTSPGRLGQSVTNLSHAALDGVNGFLGSWLGVTSALGTAAACVVVAMLMARRVVTKGG